MPSTFSESLRIELIGSGEQAGVWSITTNNNLGSLIEQAISGATTLDVTIGNITLTALNGVVDQSRSAALLVSGTPGTTRVLTIPNVSKLYTVRNTSNATVQLKTASGSPFNVPAAAFAYLYCDGSNAITGRVITDGANTILSNPTPFNSPAFTGVPTAPTAEAGTNTTQLATTAFVTTATAAAIPTGVIVMWSGSIASIPAGWLLCNGANGTPDLRDRFIVGAGSTYAVGATGGANTVTLSTANLPSHTHSISGSGTTSSVDINHTHSGTTGNENQNHTHNVQGTTGGQSNDHAHYFVTNAAGAHQHTYNATFRTSGFDVEDGNSFVLFESGAFTSENGNHNHDGNTGGVNQNHTHFFNVNSAGISNNHQHAFTTGTMSANNVHTHTFSFSGTSGAAGSGTAFDIRPPYYALCFIQKT